MRNNAKIFGWKLNAAAEQAEEQHINSDLRPGEKATVSEVTGRLHQIGIELYDRIINEMGNDPTGMECPAQVICAFQEVAATRIKPKEPWFDQGRADEVIMETTMRYGILSGLARAAADDLSTTHGTSDATKKA